MMIRLICSSALFQGARSQFSKRILFLAAVLLSIGLGVIPAALAQQPVSGIPGVATSRATINFRGLAGLEQKIGGSNLTGRVNYAQPSPMLPVGLSTDSGAGAGAFNPANQISFAPASVGTGATSPPPSISFQALPDDNTSIPPDTHGAVGPNHLMTVLNTQVRIQERDGGVVSTVSLEFFWLASGVFNAFDPKVLYDHAANRWVFTAMGDARSANSAVLLGVSQTSDPTGNWFLYRIDVDPSDVLWVDYPSLGFNKDWIVVNANMYGIAVPTNAWTSIYAFNKTNLYAGGLGSFTLFQEPTGFTMVPAITYDNALATMYLVEVDDVSFFNNRLRVSTITGSVGSEQLTTGAAFVTPQSNWGGGDLTAVGFLPQLGSPFGIRGNDTRMQNVVYRNGSLWCTHSVFLPTGFFPTHSAVQWFQFTPTGQIQQFGRIEDASGVVSYAYPSIAVNSVSDVLIGFSRFSTNQYASANYAFRSAGDPTNTMQFDYVLKAGEAPYFKTFSGVANRWGDYSSTVVDPINDLDMWTIQEYAATPVGGASRWGTWWGMVCGAGGARFELPQYTVNEASPLGFATITVLNAGGVAGSINYETSDGTGIAGTDYRPAQGVLNFNPGQLSASFVVEVIDNPDINSNKTVNLLLTNPQGGLTLGCSTNSVLTIIDDESASIVSTAGEFNFSSWVDGGIPYLVTENETEFDWFCYPGYFIDRQRSALGALLTVVRTNGSTGRVLVDYATIDTGGLAIPGIDYTPVSGTLVFDDYQMSAKILVPMRTNIFFFLGTNGHKFLNIALSNPRPAPEEEASRPGTIRPTLGLGSVAGLVIWSVNLGAQTFSGGTNITYTDAFAFERLHYRVDEYSDRDPRFSGGTKTLELSVIKPALGGRVIVRLYNHVRGSVINNFPFGNILGSSWTWIGGTDLDAGSDFASSPVGGSEILANPIYRDPSLSTITNLEDYVTRDVTLDFTGTCRREVEIIIHNDPAVEFNEDIFVRLIRIGGQPPVNPVASYCNVTILHDDQPAGALDREWNPDNVEGTPDQAYNQTPGANGEVSVVVVQPDSRTLLGGDFTAVNSKPRNRIARLNTDGSLDLSFGAGTGANGFVAAMALYPPTSPFAGRILVAGGFSSFNGTLRNGIVRLLPNGTLDPSFTPGTGARAFGLSAAIWSMAVQADGKVVVAGNFDEYNGFSRNGLARLETDGTLDQTFDPGSAGDATIRTVTLTTDALGSEKILVGGDFLFFDGFFAPGIVQLTSSGLVDDLQNFDTGGGIVGSVFSIAVQSNRSIVVGGAFSDVDSRPRYNIARLHPNGSLDLSFDSGSGADNPVYVVTIQPDQKALIGGPFLSFNGTRRMGFARLRLDGTVDTSFLDTGYNQFAGLIRDVSFAPANYANSIALQPDGNIMIGGSFHSIGGNPSYLADVPNHYTVFTRADKRSRYNIARVLGGVTPGPGNTEFEVENYYVDENGGVASLRLLRTDGRLGSVFAEAGTSDRTASVNADFINTNLVTSWPEGFYQTNLNLTFPILFPTNFAQLSVGRIDPVFLRVPILDDGLQEGDELVDLSFLRPNGSITLGGEFIPLGAALGRSKATLSILENDFNPGTFVFSSPAFVTNENPPSSSQLLDARAIITVLRTNGSDGRVTVNYFTITNVAGPRATPGSTADYLPAAGQLTFLPGQVSANFFVTIRNDTQVEFDENIGLVLTNAGGGAKLPGGLSNSIAFATLTIVDNDVVQGRLNFSVSSFTNNEAEGAALVTVTRTGGNQDQISAQFMTVDGSAVSPLDYTATNGVLSWNSGDSTPRTVRIPLNTDGLAEGTESFSIQLFNARVGGVLATNILGLRTNVPVVITDADAFGRVAFSQPSYQADEAAGLVTITVVRTEGIAGTGTVSFATSPGSAVPGMDYTETNGVLTFLPGEIGKTFVIALADDTESDGNKVVNLTLSNPTFVSLGTLTEAQLTIIDNRSFNEPAGSLDTSFDPKAQANGPVFALALQMTNGISDGRLMVAGDFTDFNQVTRNRLARLMTNGILDTSFDPGPGANGAIRSLGMQPDGKLVFAGFFTEVLGTNRNRIARLNPDGSLDAYFDPGAGADNPVYSLALQPDGKVLVGGAFSSFGSANRPGIARLATNGVVDISFNPGAGANGPVFAVALQGNGRVLIGGDFTAIDGVPRNRIARLNPDGSLDNTFNPGFGMNGAVRALLFQSDGKVVAGGSFTTVDNVGRNFLARLNQDGTLDTNFLNTPLTGGDGSVFALAQQVDGRIVVGGDFRKFNGVNRNRITRLTTDGSSDPTINFGNGTDAFIAALLIQPDRKIVLGGGFTKYDETVARRIARIHGGAIAGPGTLEFSRPEFLVAENGTNALITVRRRGGTTGSVGVNYRSFDGTALDGVHYVATSGTLAFPPAETFQTFFVPVLDNSAAVGDLIVNLELIDGTYTGGAVPGPQPNAQLRILDDEGIVGFTTANFSFNENVASLFAAITVHRSGATNAPVSLSYATVASGSAIAFADYIPTNGTLAFLPGELVKTFHVRLLDDVLIEGNESFGLALSNASNSNAFGIALATLVIVDNEFSEGQFVFSSPTYAVSESATNAVLTVLRTNGSSGFVSVNYFTSDFLAVGGLDYLPTNNILAFADGETSRTIEVPIIDDLLVEGSETFEVFLVNPSGGAILGSPSGAVVTLSENDVSALISAGSTLLQESISTNNIIDPGERVTFQFRIRNIGTGDTSPLLGTLLPGSGVTLPSAPQPFGVLPANGAAVGAVFSFTAVGNIGDPIVATIMLTDGTATNGFVSFAFTMGGQASRTFTNSNPITINPTGPASPYPATIDVANLGGTITKITATVTNLFHRYPTDVDILLVGPNGEKVMLLSDAGGTSSQPNAITNVTLRFDDASASIISQTNKLTSGTYRPANYAFPNPNSGDTFVLPAPLPPYTNTALSSFNGMSPNGTWSLFVYDDTAGEDGGISGWSLNIQTSDPVSPAASVSLADMALGATGPSAIAVGGNLSCTFVITNRGPAVASNVALLENMPAGLAFVSANATAGSWSKVQNTLTWTVGDLPSGGKATLVVVARPTTTGTLASSATVSANQIDPNTANNSITMLTTVTGPPSLSITRQGSNLRIAWLASSGFKLQTTDSLNPANWSDVGITPQNVNGENVVTVGVSQSGKFYRLRSP